MALACGVLARCVANTKRRSLEPVHGLLSKIVSKVNELQAGLRCLWQFFHNLLFFSSQAKLRSTNQRLITCMLQPNMTCTHAMSLPV